VSARSARCAAALLLLRLLSPAAARAAEAVPGELVLGFSPGENAEGLRSSADALARALADRIHCPVRAYVALDYTALVEALRAGQVHLAWMTPAPLVLAERLLDVQILLTQVRHGAPTYYGAIVVRQDSPVSDVAALRGKTIAWVDPQSTSGYVIPRYLLLQRGIDPQRFFKQQVFAGGHDSAVIAVQAGQVDAAAVWADPPGDGTGAWTRFLQHRPGPRLRPILYTPPVPSDTVVVDSRFARAHPLLISSARSALIAIGNDAEGRAILRRLNGTDGFVVADPSQYEIVRSAFAATRAPHRTSFQHPVSVLVLLVLCACAAALVFPRWRRARRARTAAAWLLFASLVAWSFLGEPLALGKLYSGRAAMLEFLRAMFPPDRSVVPAVLESSVVTVQLALIGTLLAIPFALALAFLSAENVIAAPWLRRGVRGALNLNRSIDTLIVALILVSAVGLGPLPGVIAIALHSVGALGKPCYEAIETLDPRPAEAMRAVGATPLQVLRWGIWPQFAPHFVSILLFRFELNVRVSTVLGLVGAGGIGFLLITYMRGAEYAKVTVVIGAIVVLVMALDSLSTRLRHDVSR
jgi:phosphonate ABC transporter permease subunit PhnE